MRRIISLLLSLTMVFSFSMTSMAAESREFDTNKIVTIGDSITPEAQDFLDKVESVFPYFEIGEDNRLSISLSNEELTSEFGFTDEDIMALNEMLRFQSNAVDNSTRQTNERVYVSDWKIYFDAIDVQSYLFAAAQIGPAAIIAALSALGSSVPGAGTVVGAIVGVFGASTIIYYVFQAVSLGKGMYIGVDWNGPFPVPAIGLW
ncbi:MAG: hypothetical protein IJP92_10405 [Lachnospiraceae bacterium]|nr:hypothetical protein [Lachnospiraceae bacterium]